MMRREILAHGADSPRVWWTRTWYAWLKQQVGDPLTAEQYGANAVERLRASLGPAHPLSQAATVVQYRTLIQRGATIEAAALAERMLRASGDRPTQDSVSADGRPPLTTEGLDVDSDGDGLADLLERYLGTSPSDPARAGAMFDGRPLRSLALPLSPAHVVAHKGGLSFTDEGFDMAPGSESPAWLHVMPSVQRGYAERYGWVLVVDGGTPGCAIELDTGSPSRRLRLTSPGATARKVVDFESSTRTLHWWSSDGLTRVTSFDDLPISGPGPYGLRLSARDPRACPSVSWVLRAAAIAPM
jgi:hypothetical protein